MIYDGKGKTPEHPGLCYANKEAQIYYTKLRISNRLGWLEEVKGNNKYTPHQGKQECERRKRNTTGKMLIE